MLLLSQFYTVWTLTSVIGLPYKSMRILDVYTANIYLSLYYGMMSILCLNLFIALLSQTFSTSYEQAKSLARLEQAKGILESEIFLSEMGKQEVGDFFINCCSPWVSE